MSNEILWFLFVLLDLSLVLLLFKFFGRTALYSLIVFNLLLCNIQVTKTITLFGLTTTLGNILYASVFLATDILGEYYGKSAAKKGVFLGFIALVMAMVYMQIALAFTPDSTDFAHVHLEKIFGLLPRLTIASTLAYLFSQFHDVWAYHFWRTRTQGRLLWLRNNASTLTSQALDSAIFCLIAFYGLYPAGVLWEIFLTTFLFKAIVAVLDTPFLYLTKWVIPLPAQQPTQDKS